HGARRGASKLMLDELLGKPLDGRPGRVEFGDDHMNFIHGEDAAAAFVALANGSGGAFTAYNIRGDYRPVRDAVEIARRLLPGSDIEALPGAHGWAWDADDAPLRRDTGYTPKVTLELGLEDTLDRLRAERARRAD